MGATTFETYAYGTTAREAFESAVQEAIFSYGHEPYSGTIKEKDGFVEISVPKGHDPEEYAAKLSREDDDRIADKWGPAGCIKISSEAMTEEVPYATTQERYNQNGARKWETVFKVIKSRRFMEEEEIVAERKSQTEAEKYAKSYAKDHNCSVRIRIEKKLVNGNQDIVTIHPKTKTVKSRRTRNKYVFFGWASC